MADESRSKPDALTSAAQGEPAPEPETKTAPKEPPATSLQVMLHAAGIAVLFVPVYCLSYTADCFPFGEIWSILTLLLPLVLAGGLAAALAKSDTVLQVLVKCLLSLPVTLLFWMWMQSEQIILRAVNWTNPGYGTLSAGAGFAAGGQFFILAAAHITGLLVGIAVTRGTNSPDMWKLLRRIAYLVCIVILLAFMALCLFLPAYHGEVG